MIGDEGEARVAGVKWDELSLQQHQAELTRQHLAGRQRIDEPKTRRWLEPEAARLSAGVTLQPKLMTTLKELFDAIDADGNGEISRDEATKFWGGNFASLNTASMFNQVDADGDATITLDEYLTFWKAVVGCGYSEDELIEEVQVMLRGRSWVSFNRDPFTYSVAGGQVPAASTAVLSRAAHPGYSEAMRRFYTDSHVGNPFESRLLASMRR